MENALRSETPKQSSETRSVAESPESFRFGGVGQQLGFALRDRGLELVESRDRSLAEILRDEARRIARAAGTVTIDDVRDFADQHGFVAPHKNFWGCIFRGDEWVAVGSEPSGRVGKHAHRNTVWRLR